MPTPKELERKFWDALKSDRTMMLGLVNLEESHCRPMTAQFEEEGGPIWFFTAKDTELVSALPTRHRAMATFAAKGHDLFATLHGNLMMDNDRAVIDRLWNRFVAAWYEGGKDDPKLALLRFEPERAQIWENENSLVAGVKMLLGADPKKEYRDKVAEVKLG
jgi:general stress protein 26